MGKLRIMTHQGDRTVTWDEAKAKIGDPEALKAIREAERLFEMERANGATAFSVTPDSPPVKLHDFDKAAEQIVMVPRIAGG